jgi:hypothetical protein
MQRISHADDQKHPVSEYRREERRAAGQDQGQPLLVRARNIQSKTHTLLAVANHHQYVAGH